MLYFVKLYYYLRSIQINFVSYGAGGVCHKFGYGRIMLLHKSGKEPVGLHIENAAVVYLSECSRNLIPPDLSGAGESVQIGDVIDVMSVYTTKTLPTDDAYSILRLSATERHVTEVEADSKGIRII